jgi:hippurate hydrolase
MLVSLIAAAIVAASDAPPAGIGAAVDALSPELEALYCDLHRTPELSRQELKTAAKLAARLRALGFQVTTGVGGHGVVGLLRNGAGPTVMLRTDMDALPVREEVKGPCASRETARNESGATVPVMHACGHDVHMTAWVAAATILSGMKDRWRGTLMMVGQPAEEVGEGARAMLKDGLFTRFPRPDVAVMVHDSGDYPAGTVALVPGFALANVDSVDITIHGRGGHGSKPQTAIDPIVIASRVVLSLQTLISRENDPFSPAVITVGSIHGGTKHNIIPAEVKLQITVRSYQDAVRRKLLAGIDRIARAEAQAAGAPRAPEVSVVEGISATYNDPEVVDRLRGALSAALGPDRVLAAQPVMGGEDFSEYGRAGVKASMIWVGATPPAVLAAAADGGTPPPGMHSGQFLPERPTTVKVAAAAMTAAGLEFLGRP